MNKLLSLLSIIFLFSMLTGCASTVQYVPFPDQTKSIENPEMSRIYVVRPTIFGGGIPMKVRNDDKLIGRTGPKGYLCWERKPGKTQIIGTSENTSVLDVNLKKGLAYYIQQHVQMGFIIARNKLSLLNEDEGKLKVSQCKQPILKELKEQAKENETSESNEEMDDW